MQQIRLCTAMLNAAGRRRLVQLGLLILLNTILEVATVGMILPFIALLNNPGLVETHGALQAIYRALGLGSTTSFLALIGTVLFVLVVGKNVYLYWLMRLQSRFGYFESARVAERLFAGYLAAPYQTHLNRNSADMITTVDYSVDAVFSQVLLYVIIFATEASVVLALILFMLATEPWLTLALGVVLGGCAALLMFYLRRELVELGRVGIQLRIARLQCLQQGLTSIKEVKVLGREKFFLDAFHRLRQQHAANQARAATVSQLPRQVLEVVVVGGLLLVIVLVLLQGRPGTETVEVLGLFAMAAFRIMPALNRMVNAYNTIKNGEAAVDEVWADFSDRGLASDAPAPAGAATVSFARELSLRDVSFAYENSALPVLQNVSLEIRPGESIGFVGPSGAGKSTLIDIILGLLAPQSGLVEIDCVDMTRDSRMWRRLIGYVPQTISLVDDSLRNNIAFGIEPGLIDEDRMWKVLALARLDEFCRSLPDGLDTTLGERGVRLSGGQRQRVGIARALYHDPKVLIFDEATSALDSESERDITDAIEAMRGDKTILIIAHRLSTVKRCDRLVLLRKGAVADIGTFEELIGRRDDFREMVQLAELIARTPDISALH
jgi:ABC-type multidrug transport system fused ATPase/permease subunit